MDENDPSLQLTNLGGPASGSQAQFNLLLQLIAKIAQFLGIKKTTPVLVVNDKGGNLVAGAHTIPAVPAALYRYVQNQDTAPLTLQFGVGGAKLVLNEAGVTGEAGGMWNTNDFLADTQIFTGQIFLTSTIATAQYAAGDS